MIRWGILGSSFISEVMAKAIQASKHSQLIAMASRSTETARLFSEKFSIPHFYDDYENLLNDESVDVIYIGLPNHLHKEWIIRCAQAGKHILCEKSLVLNTRELHEVINAVQGANVLCMEALMYRPHPFINKIQSLLRDEKIIGDIRLYHAVYTANIAKKANTMSGGCIRNLGCYPLSLVRMLANSDPLEIKGMGRHDVDTHAIRQASIMMSFSDESMAMISTADDIEMFWQFEVFGTKGRLKSITNPWMPDMHDNILLVEEEGKNPVEIKVSAQKPLYTYQIDIICEYLLHAKDELISLSDSLSNIKILETWETQANLSHLQNERLETAS